MVKYQPVEMNAQRSMIFFSHLAHVEIQFPTHSFKLSPFFVEFIALHMHSAVTQSYFETCSKLSV